MSERYRPCRTGLHVCGADEEANEFFTQVNFPCDSADEARAAFAAARAECEAGAGEPMDFVVDLFIGGDCCEDFSLSRQMLPRLERGFPCIQRLVE